ncbi:hypothetical protein BN14_11073 [Rhizoctonia solani AG-1 IB]|uniref:Uncharacterized protein n=1 Tax=Thanatephorus cucumeris (strain AG1-IB / isolate 7/3/14) TaxID=1108050 RepID=M5CCQ7_THACB|nr:hypothetical protein BN14_11073 [Rhizoctonia solani AG-1 IB]
MIHYSESICQLGAADGYNTETPEQLHIMTAYLEQRKRVAKFNAYLCWALPDYAERLRTQQDVFEEPIAPGWRLALTSPVPPVRLSILPRVYGIQDFKYYINKFFEDYFPGSDLTISPDNGLTVFPKATQIINNAFVTDFVDCVNASLAKASRTSFGSKFDTVLIRKIKPGKQFNKLSYGMSEHCIGCVLLIFKLPPHYNIPNPLVYIQRFDGPNQRDPLVDVNMHGIKRLRHTQVWGERYVEEVVPLVFIRQTCHLVPRFGKPKETPSVDDASSDPLELFDKFYVNSYFDLHLFQLLSL